MKNSEEKLEITKNIVIVYHGQCTDGFGGAWSAWKKLGDSADYFGASYDNGPPKGLTNKEIYFIDFVYSRPVMEDLKQKNKRIVIIDHHKTAQDKLDIANDKLFDINHSGAVLSWQYFHPDKSIPIILKCIEDRDIWRWKVEDSKEILAYFDLFDFDFKIWNEIIEQFDHDESLKLEFKKNGQLLLRQWTSLCEDMIKEESTIVEFEGYKTYVINAPHIFASDLGNILSKKLPPLAIVWQQNKEGNIGVSLRSDGSVDVSEIAKKYGGGGHKAAAGLRIESLLELPWKKIK